MQTPVRILAIIISILAGRADASPVQDLSGNCNWSVYEDINRSVGVAEARSLYESGAFSPAQPEKISLGFSKSRLWVFGDCSMLPAGQSKVAVIEYAFLDRIAGYTAGSDEATMILGDNEEIARTNDFSYRLPAFALKGGDQIFLRIETSGSLQVPLTVLDQDEFHKRTRWENFVLGIYYGIFGSLFLYNLCLWAMSGIAVYGRYSAFVALYGAFQLSANGFLGFFEQPFFAWLRNDGLSLSILGSQGLLLLFTSKFLTIESVSKSLKRVIEFAGSGFFLSGLVLALTVDYARVSSLTAIVAMFVPVLVLVLGVIQVVRRNNVAMVFVVAQITYLAGVALLGAKNLGLIEPSVIANYAVQLGSAVEMILLSLGLGVLIRTQIKNNHELTLYKTSSQAVVRTAKMLAHDMRGPLRTFRDVLARVQTAGSMADIAGLQASIRASTCTAWQRLDHMLADFMEFGEQLRLNQSRTDLQAFLQEFEQEVKADSRYESLEFAYEFNHGSAAHIDVYRTRRVLSNLISNAAEATGFNTRITVATSERADGFISIKVHNTNSRIRPQDLPHIFDPYFTSGKERGTGLGLAIAAHIVRAHGGEISASSDAGGTAVSFSVPVAAKQHQDAVPSSSPRATNVVVIDDCPFVLENWQQTLRHTKLWCFRSPQEAFAAIDSRALDISGIDVFIVDRWFNQTSDEDGADAIVNLRQDRGFAGAIFLSSDDQSATHVDHIITARIDKKSCSIETLLARRA